MSLILTLDMMGKRYGRLPSEIVNAATTFDLVIMDAAVGYQAEMQKRSDPKYVPDVPVEDLIKLKEKHQ